MDVIPLLKFISLLLLCGLVMEFPLMFVYEAVRDTINSTDGMGTSDPYISAVIWVCIYLPPYVVLFGGGARYWMHSQKRSN